MLFFVFGGAIILTMGALGAFVTEMLLAARGVRLAVDHSAKSKLRVAPGERQMATSLILPSTDPRVEAVYGWLEQHPGFQVQFWGLENQRRAALLAYSDGPADAFGWSNWASKADDPSEIVPGFEQLELIVEDGQAGVLNSTFLGLFSVVPNTKFT